MYKDKPMARAITGRYIGKRNSRGTLTFRGIRYAEFAGRWKRLKPIPPSDDLFDALDTGPACPQVNFLDWYALYRSYPRNEIDCFRLNVSTSDLCGRKPVFVFIHGGGNITGGIFDSNFDTESFVDRNPDIVFVVFNYRLGVLGTLCLSEYTDNPDYRYSGNLSVLDQVTALKWINENISAFGGDPENVTVAGQSAGSASLFRHMTIRKSWRYWRRVVCQSGTTFFNRPLSLETACSKTRQYCESLGVSSLDDLLNMPVDTLLKVHPFDLGLEHVEDGITLPKEINAILCAGDREACASGKEIMIGCTVADMDREALDKEDYEKTLSNAVRAIRESLNNLTSAELAHYAATYVDPSGNQEKARIFLNNFTTEQGEKLALKYITRDTLREPFIAVSDMLNDYAMQRPLMLKSNGLCRNNTVFYYNWEWFPEKEYPLRAIHSVDVPFVTNNKHKGLYMKDVASDEIAEMYNTVQEIWGNFIRHGRPDFRSLRAVPYDPETKPVLYIGLQPRYESNPRNKDFDLLKQMFEEYLVERR